MACTFLVPAAAAAAATSLQSCPTLCSPIDGSPTGSPVPDQRSNQAPCSVSRVLTPGPPGNPGGTRGSEFSDEAQPVGSASHCPVFLYSDIAFCWHFSYGRGTLAGMRSVLINFC